MYVVRFVIEFISNNKSFLEKKINELLNEIKENFKIVDSYTGKIAEMEQGTFSTFLEVTIDFESFEDIFAFILDFTPISVEFLKPEKVTLTAGEIQNILNDFASKVNTVAAAARILARKVKSL